MYGLHFCQSCLITVDCVAVCTLGEKCLRIGEIVVEEEGESE